MFGYTTIENLRSELSSLYNGTEYGSGYFKTTFEDIKENELSISIFDVLDSLEAFEIIKKEMYDSEEEGYFEYDIEEYFEKGLDEGWLVENGCDNTYNWNSPISHHINFEIYHNIDEGNYIVRFRVHCGYCDVRVGYSDWVYLECNSDYDFLEALMECGKWIEVEYKLYIDEIVEALLENMDNIDIFDDELQDMLDKIREKKEE